MIQLLVLIIILIFASILRLLGHTDFGRIQQTTNNKFFIRLAGVTFFAFWISTYYVTWLVAFKYHSQSRQLLRIERLHK